MKILRVVLENFRGVRNATYEFSERMKIKGRNGSGKSTIASAYFWLMSNQSYDLQSNPQVRPVDAIDEVVSSVTAELDMDGKHVEIKKSQKLKRSKTGAVALTNSYMVNSVPKSEKDYKSYLTELGIDFDKFLPCSHPGVLLSGINNKKERTALRNLLFEMASDITDWDVAKGDPELKELEELLQNYDTEEVAAIQNNTLRKIRENYGKEGEILRAKIEGLESAKVEVDTAIVQSKIDDCDLRIAEVDRKIQEEEQAYADRLKLSSDLMDKKFALSKMEDDANRDVDKKKSDFTAEVFKMTYEIKSIQNEIDKAESSLKHEKNYLAETKEKRDKNLSVLESIRDFQFDDSKSVCPTCGQKLPAKKVKAIIADAQEKHKEKVKAFQDAIDNQNGNISASEDRISRLTEDVKKYNEHLKKAKEKLRKKEDEIQTLDKMPKADMSSDKKYQKLAKEIAEMEKLLPDEEKTFATGELKEQKRAIQSERSGYMKEISMAENNKNIDAQIEKAREDQRNYEQNKADAEMILDQLKSLNMKKNELLQDSVNKNFRLIKWQLFDFLKNGTPIDTCVPTIDGKKFGESMNTGLETMAKIDAINAIQKFFGLDYPIWLDNAEHLDSESMKKLKTDHQLIVLSVSDDPELVFEEMKK